MIDSSIKKAFLQQAQSCQKLGSPFTARICKLVGENMPKTGAVWEQIQNWSGDISGHRDSVPLRLAGALHGLVLENKDSSLARVYPPDHDEISDEILWKAITAATENHGETILEKLQSAPQTNEVRRTGALLPGLLKIAEDTGLSDFVMSELGASAGLNMFWDQFHYSFNGEAWGRSSAETRLQPDWKGAVPAMADLKVLSRAGCDLNPIDVSNKDQQKRLLSYIWPDQEDRIHRTISAINLAAENKVYVEKADAIDWLENRLAKQHDGAVHVIYHTVAWQYFPAEKQKRGEILLRQAGEKASRESPLAWLRMEGDGQEPGAGLTLTLWPSGETQTLARVDYHGRWIHWLG